MSTHFTPYEGDKPYLFISYAHLDAARVLPIIKELHQQKYRVWYDTGIEAGANWPEVIAGHLSKAATILFFVSKQFPLSQNCAREVNFAVDQKLPMMVVYLDSVELPAGMKMQLSEAIFAGSTADEIMKSVALTEDFIGDGIEGYTAKTGKKHRKINAGLVIGLVGTLIAAIALIALLGVTQGWFGGGVETQTVTVSDDTGVASEQMEITTWTSTVMRDLLISQADSTALYACGNHFVTSRLGIEYDDGAFRLAGEPVEQGDISDLTAIADKSELVELSLCWQQIEDLSPLQSLSKLSYLDVSGNRVDDISALTSLNTLTTLKVPHTNVTDLTPTLEMPSLKQLTISYDMVSYAEAILGGKFDIIITE